MLGTLLGARPAGAEPGDPVSLLECHIAGTSYRPSGLEDVEPFLVRGAVLRLEREPQNKFDDLAIAVYDQNRRHLGYVPRAKNEVLAWPPPTQRAPLSSSDGQGRHLCAVAPDDFAECLFGQ